MGEAEARRVVNAVVVTDDGGSIGKAVYVDGEFGDKSVVSDGLKRDFVR